MRIQLAEYKRLSQREFEDGLFGEEELRAIKRLFPVAYSAKARSMSRRDFFIDVYANLKSSRKNLGSIRRTFYNMSLSKRDEETKEETEEISPRPLSVRD